MTIFNESGGEGPPYTFTPLKQSDRFNLVELSGNPQTDGFAYMAANTLELSALGATTDLLGTWNAPAYPGMAGYHHIAVAGRDVYVKIVERGWLFPFGHPAVLIRLYERVIEGDPEHANLYADAYVGIKFYVRILQTLKTYPAFDQPWVTESGLGTNDWPFQSVNITTTTSPEIDANLPELVDLATTFPLDGGEPSTSAQQALMITSGGAPVQWSFVAFDPAGNELHLKVPQAFIFGAPAPVNGQTYPPGGPQSEYDSTAARTWLNAYNKLDAATWRTAQGNGQPWRAAPEAGGPAGGTTHPLVSLTLGAATPIYDPNGDHQPSIAAPNPTVMYNNGQPAFYPTVASSVVRVKSADLLSGQPGGFTDGTNPGVGIQWFPQYVTTGLPESDPPTVPLQGVYAQLQQASSSGAPPLNFPGNLVGGLGTPNLGMAGLSAITGPVGGALSDLSNYANSAFSDLKSQVQGYFNGLESEALNLLPQLFGCLKLSDILAAFSDLVGGIPNLTVTSDSSGNVTITYKLSGQLDSFPSPDFPLLGQTDPIFAPNYDVPGPNPGMFNLQATIYVPLSKVISGTPPTPTYDVEGSLTPFYIYLLGQETAPFIQIPFNGFKFSAKTGSKTKVDPSVGQVQFIGALSFVNALESFLSNLGGSGLSIVISPTEVDANFSLALPPIGIGVLDLSGISFSAGVQIPFLGDPALVTFGFATQDNPFTLTVMMFGGGGFLALGIGFKGVQTVQASFQFEGQFAIDLGVASGGITLAAGVYYSYAAPDQPSPGTTLTGFVRLTGELEVLGIISISAELDLTLTYVEDPNGHYVQGTATLKISIHIIFFSITVPITVTKQFAGSGTSTAQSSLHGLDDELDGPLINPTPVSPVTPITFAEIVAGAANWQSYCEAFAG